MDSLFTYNPNFPVDSLHQQPQSPRIPHEIREILPAWILINFVYKFGYSAPGFYKFDQFEGGFTHLCDMAGILNWIF